MFRYILPLMLLGCGTSNKLAVEIDGSFSPEELAQVNQALDEWETMPGVLFQPRVIVQHREGMPDSGTVRINNTVNRAECGGRTGWNGHTEQRGNKFHVCILKGSEQDYFLRTVTHELGHVLQLEHIENPKGVMYEATSFEWKGVLTDIDRQQYCNEWGC